MDPNKLSEIEYESLYKEIDKHSDRLIIIVNFDIVAVTAILGVVFNLKQDSLVAFGQTLGQNFPSAPVLFLLPLVVLLPSFVLVTEELNSTARIAAYIRVFYERRTSAILWQETIQCIRREDTRRVPTQFLRKALRFLLPSLAGTCIILSMLSGILGGGYVFLYMLVPWALGVGFTVCLTRLLGKPWQRDNIDRLSKIVENCVKKRCVSDECSPNSKSNANARR